MTFDGSLCYVEFSELYIVPWDCHRSMFQKSCFCFCYISWITASSSIFVLSFKFNFLFLYCEQEYPILRTRFKNTNFFENRWQEKIKCRSYQYYKRIVLRWWFFLNKYVSSFSDFEHFWWHSLDECIWVLVHDDKYLFLSNSEMIKNFKNNKTNEVHWKLILMSYIPNSIVYTRYTYKN